jgi:hypothetical protein
MMSVHAASLPLAAAGAPSARGRSRTVTVLKRDRSGAVFKNRGQLPGNGRSHRTLHFSANSANGGLQSTSVTGPEDRQWRVWVDSVEKLDSRPERLMLPKFDLIERPLLNATRTGDGL